MFVSELEGSNEAQNLLNITTDREVRVRNVANDSLTVDDDSGTESNTAITVLGVSDESTVVSGDPTGEKKRVNNIYKSAKARSRLTPW